MRRLLGVLLWLGFQHAWDETNNANAKRILGSSGYGSDHTELPGNTWLRSDAIHTASAAPMKRQTTNLVTSESTDDRKPVTTSTTRIEIRQQEAFTESCASPSTIQVGQASCMPVVADTTLWACGTSIGTSVGCNIGGDTITTSTITTASLTARCAQEGCGTCLSLADTPPSPVAVPGICKNCTTTSDLVFASPITTLPSNYKSGQFPAQTSAPSTLQAPQVRRDVSLKAPLASSSRISLFDRFVKNLSRSLLQLYDGAKAPRVRNTDVSLDETPSDLASNATFPPFLRKRTMMRAGDYGGNHNDFMVMEAIQASTAGMLVPHRGTGTGGRSSAKVNGFRTSGFNIAVDKLNGCTAVLVVSRKGAHLAHIWEMPSMYGENAFGEDVLYGLFQGDDSGYLPGISDHSHDMSLFNTLTFGETKNVVQPIIVTPSVNPSFWGDQNRPWRNMHQVQEIQNMLQDMFHVDPIVSTYDLVDGDVAGQLDKTAHGKVLIQYDPRQYLPTEKVTDSGGRQHSCIKQYAAVRVYSDVNIDPIYEDTWLALPEQAKLLDPDFGRQEGTQQVFQGHKIRIRDENEQISIYGCVKLVTNETESTSSCDSCTTAGSCTLNPDDDQGQDGVPEDSGSCTLCTDGTCSLDPDDDQGQDGEPPTDTGTCPVCTETSCGLDPDDDQGQDGPAPPLAGTTNSTGWNTTTSSNSSTASITAPPCTLVTMSGATVSGTTYAPSPACGCGKMTGPLRTATGSDGFLTYGCQNNLTTIPISTGNLTLTSTPTCSIVSVSGSMGPESWHLGTSKCACGSSTTDIVTQTGTDRALTLKCGTDNSAAAVSTITNPATLGPQNCSISTKPAETVSGLVTLPTRETCACAGGQQAPVTTYKEGESWYIGCVGGNATATISTATGPYITECAITLAAQNASAGGWSCYCNDDQTVAAIASSVGPSATAYACPTETPYPVPVTTITAPPPSGCSPRFMPGITMSEQLTSTVSETWTCDCSNNVHVPAITSMGDNSMLAIGCVTNSSETSYITTAQVASTSTVDEVSPTTTTDEHRPTNTESDHCRLHVRLATKEWHGDSNPNVTVDFTVFHLNNIAIYHNFFNHRFLDDPVTYYTAFGIPWHLTHNFTLDIRVSLDQLQDEGLAPKNAVGLLQKEPDPDDNLVLHAHKKFTYGDQIWSSYQTKDNVAPGKPYCGMGGWASPETPHDEFSQTQDFDCFFDCFAVKDPDPIPLVPHFVPEPNLCKLHVTERTKPNADNELHPEMAKSFAIYDQAGKAIWTGTDTSKLDSTPIFLPTAVYYPPLFDRYLAENMTVMLALDPPDSDGHGTFTSYESFYKRITYGDDSWDAYFGDVDTSRSWCRLGKWDIGATDLWGDAFTQSQQFDCWFRCLVMRSDGLVPSSEARLRVG